MVSTHAVRNNSPLCDKQYTCFVQSFLQCFSPFQKLLSQDRLKAEPSYHSLSVAVKCSLFFSLLPPASFIFQIKGVQVANCEQNIIISQETQSNSSTAFAALLSDLSLCGSFGLLPASKTSSATDFCWCHRLNNREGLRPCRNKKYSTHLWCQASVVDLRSEKPAEWDSWGHW